MSQHDPGEDPDPIRSGLARFLDGRIAPGLRLVAPAPLAALPGAPTPPEAEPPGAELPDWAVVPRAGAFPEELLRRLLAEASPVFANDGYVVFARRPTFGLPNLRDTPPLRALADRAAGRSEPAPPPRPAPAPGLPPSRPPIPPPAARPTAPPPPARAEPPAPPAIPPVPAPATPPGEAEFPPPPSLGGPGWGGLPARVAAMLGPLPGRRVGALGTDANGTARALAAAALPPGALLFGGEEALPESCLDAALLLPGGAPTGEAARLAGLLRPGGLALLVAENAASLGRRLAAALNRPVPPGGTTAEALRGAAHAAGLVPLRLEGHGLDAWRATAEAPPRGLGPMDAAAALLEEAGQDAGPRHAAWLLLLVRKP
ncbi:hypothetical protein EAH89_01760 [Roseomonas nepalensis]|uniref:Uncharacterized protein n=1 Tax=Muricoccus nepalensis TaxID=1854500 RepID=A0A502GHF8_9PROT|nr:hypothetical protein [Roseomonas nepalensis]TPG61304.1 hypothetical protein EAH89_01760 [Roseomonas nepalensis]